MKKEKSAGVIVFRKFGDEVKYLLLHYESGHWEYPKGHVEQGEDDKKTAIREAEEETGLKNLEFLPGFKENLRYFYKKDGETIMKDVMFFLAESKEGKVELSFEHQDFKWLNFEDSLKQLTYDSSKKILEKAHEFLVKKEKSNLNRFFKSKKQ